MTIPDTVENPHPSLSVRSNTHLQMPVEYMVTESDAIAYINICLIASACLVVGYIGAVAEIIPIWLLCVIVLLALPRWVINFHELIHVYHPEQMNRFICVMGVSPIPLSVLTLSYGELRSLHFAHHRSPTTEDDPDAFHIRGPLWQIIFTVLTLPEQRTLRWIGTHGLSLTLAVDLVLKALIFMGLAWIGGATFLWFWLCLRVVYGLSDFSFFRLVHHRAGDYGSFAVTPPVWLAVMAELVWGKTVVYATLNHDIHHLNPCIAVHHLPTARPNIPLETVIQELSS